MRVYFWRYYKLSSIEADSFDAAEDILGNGDNGIVIRDLDSEIAEKQGIIDLLEKNPVPIKIHGNGFTQLPPDRHEKLRRHEGLYREQLASLMKAKNDSQK